MRDVARRALALWPLHVQSFDLAAHRENAVYRCSCDEGDFALRLHRKGYRDDGELISELAYMAAIADGGVSVPQPVKSGDGRLVEHVDGIQVSVLTWLGGAPLGQTGMPLNIADRTGTFYRFGRLIARMHDIADGWQRPSGFTRQRWDVDGLLGEAPQWGRFWDNPMLNREQHLLMVAARGKLADFMRERRLDEGLIHADLVSENVLVDGPALRVIDFDDSGFGFRAQDLATALVKHEAEADYAGLRSALLAGYRSARAFDDELLDHFLLMRHLSYVGWIVPRMETPAGVERCRAFIAKAVMLAEKFVG